jgi:hypothetical protein
VKWQQSTSEVQRTNGLGCGTFEIKRRTASGSQVNNYNIFKLFICRLEIEDS